MNRTGDESNSWDLNAGLYDTLLAMIPWGGCNIQMCPMKVQNPQRRGSSTQIFGDVYYYDGCVAKQIGYVEDTSVSVIYLSETAIHVELSLALV